MSRSDGIDVNVLNRKSLGVVLSDIVDTIE